MRTLPDYLGPGLDIVIVGINPSLYSVQQGHYYARPGNRFWRAANQAGLFAETLDAATDSRVLKSGVGLTDVVKRPTAAAAEIQVKDFGCWAPVLTKKLKRFKPRIVCFQGIGGYRNYLRYGRRLAVPARLRPGRQDRMLEASIVFLVPSPSGLNAQYSLEDLVGWYRRLGELRDEL